MPIFTNHALDRLDDRKIPQKLVLLAFNHPDHSRQLDSHGTMEYSKSINNHLVSVVAKKNNAGEWIIISCWAEPPFAGSSDIAKKQRYQAYLRAGFFGKLWFHVKRQLLGQEF